MTQQFFKQLAGITMLALCVCGPAQADRVKDLASVAAVRTNQLVGYGIVVGLQGTGDGAQVAFTVQTVRSMLVKMGVGLDGPLSDFEQNATSGKIDIKNVAAVMVTAELPGFAKPGQKIDVNVSAIGKATSLRGGNLLLTSLRGVDGEIYSLAQGALTATGVETSAAGSKVSIGVPTSARIPCGATFERSVDRKISKYSLRDNGRSVTTDTLPLTRPSITKVRPVIRAASWMKARISASRTLRVYWA